MLITKVELSCSQAGNSTSIENNFDCTPHHCHWPSPVRSLPLLAVFKQDTVPFFGPEAIASGVSSTCTPQYAVISGYIQLLVIRNEHSNLSALDE
jgi:hypothetical protein